MKLSDCKCEDCEHWHDLEEECDIYPVFDMLKKEFDCKMFEETIPEG